jgi:hypothetical protein
MAKINKKNKTDVERKIPDQRMHDTSEHPALQNIIFSLSFDLLGALLDCRNQNGSGSYPIWIQVRNIA